MALKIRLRQQGRRNHAVFRLVLTNSRTPRDGKYIELLGSYDPHSKENGLSLKPERISFWIDNGAILSDNATALVKKVAPDMLAEKTRMKLKKREKVCEKRRASRKKKEAVTA